MVYSVHIQTHTPKTHYSMPIYICLWYTKAAVLLQTWRLALSQLGRRT